MSAQFAAGRMTIEEFLDWADAREDEGRYELDNGLVIAMAPERVAHSRAKFAAARAMSDAVAKAKLPCEVFIEGPGLRIDASTSYQPDAVVDCGARLPGDVRFVATPVIVVEILSPSTAYRDLGRKARNYFRVGSVAHYLIVDADDRVVTHHRRGEGGAVLAKDYTEGGLTLEPPGLTVAIGDLLPPVENDLGS